MKQRRFELITGSKEDLEAFRKLLQLKGITQFDLMLILRCIRVKPIMGTFRRRAAMGQS